MISLRGTFFLVTSMLPMLLLGGYFQRLETALNESEVRGA